MGREKYTIISDAFSHIANKVKLHNDLNLQDINIHLENFFRDILNVLYKDREFINLNEFDNNFTAIDLGDNINQMAFQVTSTSSLSKVRKTIKKYKSEYGYEKIVMLYLKIDKPSRKNDINDEFIDKILVEEWSMKDLGAKIYNSNDDQFSEVIKIVMNQITPELYDNYTEKNIDVSASEEFDNLKRKDARNFSDKILAVCPEIYKYRIIKYARDIASGEAELSKFSERDVRSMKYRVFEVCQEELINFCEINDNRDSLDHSRIDTLIEKFTVKACLIIEQKSKDYNYPFRNEDLLRKVVLALINECYLSFDEEGIYI